MKQRVHLQSHLKGLAKWDKHLLLCFGGLGGCQKRNISQLEDKQPPQKKEEDKHPEGEIYIWSKFATDFSLGFAFWHSFSLLYTLFMIFAFSLLMIKAAISAHWNQMFSTRKCQMRGRARSVMKECRPYNFPPPQDFADLTQVSELKAWHILFCLQ